VNWKLLLAVLFLTVAARAQTVRGVISGVVRDASGAAVAGASVTVSSEETGIERHTTTDAHGNFAIPMLDPGRYKLTAEHAPFKTFSEVLTLEVDQELLLDVPLPQAADTVQVTSAPELVRAESSTMGGVMDSQMILGLPLDGRNFYELSLLFPGAVPPAEGSAGSVRNAFAINVDGARETSNNFLLDGAYNGDPELNGVSIISPLDAIREFEVAASTYDASFGRNAGAQINVVTRSGGNQFHGTAYEFWRGSSLAARNYFAPSDQPAPDYERNQFGANVGGPVVRNRSFFFADYEGLRLKSGQTLVTNVPTLAERQGNFTGTGLTAIDPLSGSPLPGNTLPGYYQDPIGQKIAALFPLPDRNVPGANFVSSPNLTQNQNQFDTRLDQVLGAKDNLFFRYSFVDTTYFDPFNGFSTLPGYGLSIPSRAQNASLGETHSFTGALLNEVRLTYNRVANHTDQQNQGVSINHAVGLPELSTNPRDWGLSEISVNGFAPLGDENTSPQRVANNTYQISDNVSWNKGRHLVKFGFDGRVVQENAFHDVESRGFIDFTGELIGNPLEELLLGAPTESGGATMNNPEHVRNHSVNFYIHDTWRMRKNLVLNIGLRYEYNSPGVDAQNRANVYNPAVGQIVPVGVGGFPRAGYNPDYTNFAPQIGLAWSPGGRDRTVIRAGYGIHYDQTELAISEGLYFSAPYYNLQVAFDYPGIPPLTIENPFPSNFPIPIPSSATAFERNLRTPYIQQWNFGVQQKLGASRVLEVAYVGSKGTHLLDSRDINQPAPSTNPELIRPNPYYSDVDIVETEANSIYHSLQARLEQRLWKGLAVLASYTFSKSIDDASDFFSSAGDSNFPQNSNDLSAERGLSNFDIRHRFTLSYGYNLPIARGNRWLGGWQSFGVLTFQTGRPFTVLLLRDIDNSNTGTTDILGGSNDRPNVIANPKLANPNPQEWFNTNDFVTSPYGTFGNLGRNTLEGPGLATIDFSILKNTRVTERLNVQFRAEFFNLLNHPNLDLPDHFLGSPTFGQIVSAEDPRRLQFALKFLF
jgi:hypothetical protein